MRRVMVPEAAAAGTGTKSVVKRKMNDSRSVNMCFFTGRTFLSAIFDGYIVTKSGSNVQAFLKKSWLQFVKRLFNKIEPMVKNR